MVPVTVRRAPATPAMWYPMMIEVLTAITPGQDWAMATRSMTSSWLIQWSSSTNFFWSIEMITMPPPKVQALMIKQVLKRVQSLDLSEIVFSIGHSSFLCSFASIF